MNLTEAEKKLAGELSAVYPVGESAAISDWVLEFLSGKKRAERLASGSKLDAAQEKKLNAFTERLLKQEPVQYVLNQSWFCGFKFYVDRRVLIPRPETEELVEWVIANCKFPVDELTILDIGTGSGCIPVSLKRRIRKAEVWSCDISVEALEVARINAGNMGTAVHFLCLDFLQEKNWNRFPEADIIVSNPPYIPRSEEQSLAANVKENEPGLALFVPDDDALVFYRALARFGKVKLKKEGVVYAEMHENLATQVELLFMNEGYDCQVRKDLQGKPRMIRAVRKAI